METKFKPVCLNLSVCLSVYQPLQGLKVIKFSQNLRKLLALTKFQIKF